MLQKVQFNQASFKGYSSNVVDKVVIADNKTREYNGNFYLDKDAAIAMRAASLVANPVDIHKLISYDDYLKQLKNAGLVENKDYTLNEYEYGNGNKEYEIILIKNNDTDKPYKIVSWSNGKGLENYNGYQNNLYPIKEGQPLISLNYDVNGDLESKISQYENVDSKDFLPTGIDIATTSQEYINKLEAKGIKYEVSRNSDLENETTVTIREFEKGNEEKEVREITFIEGEEGSKMIFCQDRPEINDQFIRSVDVVKHNDTVRAYVAELKIDKI